MSITDDLLAFRLCTPPAAARDMMRMCALDWAVCGIAGARYGGFDAFAAPFRGAGPASLFGGGSADAANAALVNGTLSHALDFDDTHFDHIGHPSVAVMPAALAIGQAKGIALADVLDAALIGAEASVAVGLWLGRDHYQVGYHQTATAGAVGACVAATRLLGLSDTQARHALGLVSTMASGLKSQFGTMGKPLNAGLAARNGVEAATWAARGMTSAQDGLAGALGFGPTHHGSGHFAPVPDQDWRMLRISHKFHACCHGLHAMLEAIAPLSGQRPDRVDIFTHPRWMSVCNIAAPVTGLEAKFSYRLTAAMALDGRATGDIRSYDDAATQDATLLDLRDRVTVTADPSLSEMQARVVADGVTYVHDLDAPIPAQARLGKLLAKGTGLIGTQTETLWAALGSGDMDRFAHQVSQAL